MAYRLNKLGITLVDECKCVTYHAKSFTRMIIVWSRPYWAMRFHGSAGFNWYPDLPTDSNVQFISSRSVDLSEPGMAGGPMGMWYFKALKTGSQELKMRYFRVWEWPASAKNTFNVKLQVIDRRGR